MKLRFFSLLMFVCVLVNYSWAQETAECSGFDIWQPIETRIAWEFPISVGWAVVYVDECYGSSPECVLGDLWVQEKAEGRKFHLKVVYADWVEAGRPPILYGNAIMRNGRSIAVRIYMSGAGGLNSPYVKDSTPSVY